MTEIIKERKLKNEVKTKAYKNKRTIIYIWKVSGKENGYVTLSDKNENELLDMIQSTVCPFPILS